jgi:hypothetical protein
MIDKVSLMLSTFMFRRSPYRYRYRYRLVEAAVILCDSSHLHRWYSTDRRIDLSISDTSMVSRTHNHTEGYLAYQPGLNYEMKMHIS